jgi:hypothetical protein
MRNRSGYLVFIVLVSVLFGLQGCKKGENDPFFSFRSRKARVTGDWSFENRYRNTTQVLNSGYRAIVDFKVEGDVVTLRVDSFNTPHDTLKITTGKVKEGYLRLEKNSKMEYVFHYELVKEEEEVDINTNWTTTTKTVTTYKDRATGTWNFLAKIEINGVNKYKNKERISLIFETYNTSVNTVTTVRIVDDAGNLVSSNYTSSVWSDEKKYANGELAQIWVLDELRNKKMVMTREIDELEVFADELGNGFTETEKGTESMSLKQE